MSVEEELRKLYPNDDFRDLIASISGHKRLILYAVHGVSDPIFCSKWVV